MKLRRDGKQPSNVPAFDHSTKMAAFLGTIKFFKYESRNVRCQAVEANTGEIRMCLT